MIDYYIPPIELLKDPEEIDEAQKKDYANYLISKLEEMFASFRMDVTVEDYDYNAFAVMLKLKLGHGVSVNTVRRLRKDIELHLGSPIEFLYAGNVLTVAVCNMSRPVVALREVMESKEFMTSDAKIPVAMGLDLFASAYTFDLASTPNLLVAGTTGSGKSTFLNDIILSILYRQDPAEVKLVLMDMKGIDLIAYNRIPHLLGNVITHTEMAMAMFRYLEEETQRRLALFKNEKVNSIDEHNAGYPDQLPRIVVIVDEYMQLMSKNLDAMVRHITSGAAKAGIHLVLATQRPSKDVITPSIKSNIPCRASFTVVDRRESEIVVFQTGAERLLGNGDMIFTRRDFDAGVHAQCAFVSFEEVDRVIADIRANGQGIVEKSEEDQELYDKLAKYMQELSENE